MFWGGDLFAVKYFALGERVVFDDVPRAESIEVRTRVVEAAPKMPRNRWDLPLGAIAITAIFAHAMVAYSTSVGLHHTTVGVTSQVVYASGDSLHFSVAETATEFAAVGVRGARVDGENLPTGEGEDDAPQTIDTFGDTGMISMLAKYRGDGNLAAGWAPDAREPGILWGDRVGDAWGYASLGLSGVGEGGGGNNALGNYVVDHVRTTSDGFGYAHGTLGGTHRAGIGCTLRFAQPITCYRIPPDVIQRVIHANEGRFRGCYQDGLRRDPKLAGRVVTKFVIGRDGTVSAASDGGSDLADPEVVSCVARAFMSLEFPANPDGIGTVTYPIMMTPSSE